MLDTFCSNLQLTKLGSSSFHPPRKQRVLLLRRVSQGPGGAEVDDDRPLPRCREVINQASASRVAASRLRVPQPLRALRDRPIEHRQHPCRRHDTPKPIPLDLSRLVPFTDPFKEPVYRNCPSPKKGHEMWRTEKLTTKSHSQI